MHFGLFLKSIFVSEKFIDVLDLCLLISQLICSLFVLRVSSHL